MMYALGDMDGVICLAGALCKTWALLFTGEFGLLMRQAAGNSRLTHVRGEVWIARPDIRVLRETYPREQGSLGQQIAAKGQDFGITHVCRGVWSVRRTADGSATNYPRVQRSLGASCRDQCHAH